MAQFDVSAPFNRAAARLLGTAGDLTPARDRAVGTLARRLPVGARRDIQAEYSLKASRISEHLSATRGEGYVDLRGSKRGIGQIEFSGRWGGRRTAGATSQKRRNGGREVHEGTFIATLKGGNRHIVERVGKARLPIEVFYGPSIAQMLRNGPRRDRLRTAAEEILDAEIERLVRRHR